MSKKFREVVQNIEEKDINSIIEDNKNSRAIINRRWFWNKKYEYAKLYE